MPFVTVQCSPQGPIIDVLLGVSRPRQQAITAAGQQAPSPLPVRGLIDTGASSTCIDPGIIQQLGLIATGTTQISTPSTGTASHTRNQYDVSLVIVHPALSYTFHAMPIIESHLAHQGIQALIGRDVLDHCLFIYDGASQFYSLAF